MKQFLKKNVQGLVMTLALVAFLGVAAPAYAGVGVGVAPDFPAAVSVGQTNLPVGLEITNNSTVDVGSVDLSNIRLITSCGDTDADTTTCTGAETDPGVFAVGAVGVGANACLGTSFTIATNDVITGQVLFTPSATITLAQGATCRINFTVNVATTPTDDSSLDAGLQTLQIGRVTAKKTGDTLTGSGLGTDEVTVTKASPSISTQQSAGGVIGVMLNDTATLSGGSNPTGTVTFKLYPPSDATCTGAAAYTEADATAPYATNPGFASNAVGVWHWTADYAGDAANNATSSGCTAEPVTVTKASPSITTQQSAGGVVGTVLNDTATLSGGSSPTGTVTFKLYPPSDATCTGVASYTDADPSAPYATSPGFVSNAAGVWHWTADYAGDANNNAATSGCAAEPVTVTPPKGHIIVDKITNPAGDAQSFAFDAVGTGYVDFGLTDAATPNDQELDAGTYSVSETVPAGWDQASSTCISNKGDSETPGSISLQDAETVTCTFWNTKRSHLIVDKITDPAGDPTSFSILATGSGSITGGGAGSVTDATNKDYEVTAGTYSVAETVPSGWTQGTSTCSGVVIAAGETKTCTIQNRKNPVVQYCSPGYWKQPQHFDSYVAPYSASSTFSSIFGSTAFGSKTLVEVLSTGGGGLAAYGRATVGALLNASALTSGLTPAQVISAFNTTFAGAPTGTAANGYYGGANSEFTAPENCPLN